MLEPWLPASVSYLLLRQENGHLFNLSMPGLQYDLPEVSKMAPLVPLIPSQTPAVPHLRDSGHSCLALETVATIHSHATPHSLPVPTTCQAFHASRPLSELVLGLDVVGP